MPLHDLKAFATTVRGFEDLDLVTFAPTAGAARTVVLNGLADANYQGFGYPDVRVVRAPGFDGRRDRCGFVLRDLLTAGHK